MERLVDLVAPRSAVDLLVKTLVLVGVFTAFDFAIGRMMQDIISGHVIMELLITFLIGAPFGLFVLCIMAVQRKLKVRLRHLSRFDPMTGLANRRYFLEQAEEAIAKNDQSILLLLDVDHFKKVNDTWGHAVGDECLKSIGYVLARCARTDDLVGRLGGEEFGILLRDTSIDRISGIKEKLLKPMPFNAGEGLEHLTGTVSIGAVEILKGGDLNDALIAADMALYQAKQNGRARLEIAA